MTFTLNSQTVHVCEKHLQDFGCKSDQTTRQLLQLLVPKTAEREKDPSGPRRKVRWRVEGSGLRLEIEQYAMHQMS